jgi:hypothetical protein
MMLLLHSARRDTKLTIRYARPWALRCRGSNNPHLAVMASHIVPTAAPLEVTGRRGGSHASPQTWEALPVRLPNFTTVVVYVAFAGPDGGGCGRR